MANYALCKSSCTEERLLSMFVHVGFNTCLLRRMRLAQLDGATRHKSVRGRVLLLDTGCPLVFERQDFWSHCWLQRGVRLFRLRHCFRLQINPVSLATLRCHNQRLVLNAQRLDEDPLNVLLKRWVNLVGEDRQIPELLVSLDIPCLDVCATTIVIRSDVSNALMNYRLDLCWCGTLGER